MIVDELVSKQGAPDRCAACGAETVKFVLLVPVRLHNAANEVSLIARAALCAKCALPGISYVDYAGVAKLEPI